MKCKKPNCNAVVENGVCTKCGAKSDTPAATDQAKKDKESRVKEPGAASLKSAQEAQSRAVSEEKAAAVKKSPGTPEKHSDKKADHKETGHKEEQTAKPSSEKVEKEVKGVSKESELAKRVQAAKQSEPAKQAQSVKQSESAKQLEPAKNDVTLKDGKSGSGSTSAMVTPPPLQGGQAETKSGPEPEPESESKAAKSKSEAKPEPEVEAKSAPEAESKSDSSKKESLHSVTARPMEHATAKKSNTEERKKIESTIQSSVLPEPTEEKLSLKDVNLEDTAAYRNIIVTVRSMLEPREVAPTREDLYHASRALRHVMPYNFEAWRLHADLLLTAIRQLETRQLQPDPNFTLMAIPLREDDLRDAAEQALRECAHFADNEKQKIELIDEANAVRRITWF